MSSASPSPPRSYVLSTAMIIVLSIVSTLFGLFRAGHYSADLAIIPRLQSQDAVILVVAVPVLAVGLWSAHHESLRGRIVWLGALAFMTYTWASIAGQTAFNDFFLGYVVLFALSLFTLIGATATTDPEVIYRELSGQLSKTLYSGFLALVAIGLSLLWLSEIVPAIISGTTPPIVEAFGERGMHTYVLDLGVVVPSLAIAAVWLWRDCSWGYVFAGVLLVMAAILAPLLTAITVVDVQDNLVYVPLPMLVGTILPPVVAAGFAIKYLLALGGKPTADREVDESGVDA